MPTCGHAFRHSHACALLLRPRCPPVLLATVTPVPCLLPRCPPQPRMCPAVAATLSATATPVPCCCGHAVCHSHACALLLRPRCLSQPRLCPAVAATLSVTATPVPCCCGHAVRHSHACALILWQRKVFLWLGACAPRLITHAQQRGLGPLSMSCIRMHCKRQHPPALRSISFQVGVGLAQCMASASVLRLCCPVQNQPICTITLLGSFLRLGSSLLAFKLFNRDISLGVCSLLRCAWAAKPRHACSTSGCKRMMARVPYLCLADGPPALQDACHVWQGEGAEENHSQLDRALCAGTPVAMSTPTATQP